MSYEVCGEPHIEEIQQEQERHLPERHVMRLSEFYKALGDPTRIRIISALSVSELCVADIAKLLDMNQSAISHQLRVLRSVGLVTFRKDGKHAIYALDDDHVHHIFDSGLEHINHKNESEE
ncbi:MAG: metalloregulator ArsR/SmtB family transcription factor [Chloroflexota bacterium]